MTKRPRTLSAAFVRTISRPGVYGDGRGGRGLSLRVHRTATGRITKKWRERVRIDGRLTSIGLGPYPEITLAEARRKARDNSRAVRHGGDPRGRGVPTFAEAAERTIKLHRDGWKAGSPLPEQWESTFRLHAAAVWLFARPGRDRSPRGRALRTAPSAGRCRRRSCRWIRPPRAAARRETGTRQASRGIRLVSWRTIRCRAPRLRASQWRRCADPGGCRRPR